MSVTALARVKTRASLTSTTFDAMLTQIIDGLSTLFEQYTRRVLVREVDRVELHDGGTTVVVRPLRALPVESVTEIKEDSNPTDFDAATALIDGKDFIVAPDSGVVRRIPDGSTWRKGYRNVRVTYTGGYVAAGTAPQVNQTAMPEDLQEAATIQAVHFFKHRDRLGVASLSADGASLGLPPADLLPLVRKTLDRYRRWPV